jgi:hypothetical protein
MASSAVTVIHWVAGNHLKGFTGNRTEGRQGSKGPGVISLLNGGERQSYKYTMRWIDEFGREGLPHAISAEELELMLGSSQAFCSMDASNSTVSELMDRWPFLFSHPRVTNKKAQTQAPRTAHSC